MKAFADLTPAQSKEHMDELLELQLEEKELRDKRDKAQEKFKHAKDEHEIKEREIMKQLEALNQELPLFDDNAENIPWPFPISKDLNDVPLSTVAADEMVVGLSIGVVKAAREKCEAKTIGQLETALGAERKLNVDQMTKAKKELAKLIGPSQALKLLRGIHSFVEPRIAKEEKVSKNGKHVKEENEEITRIGNEIAPEKKKRGRPKKSASEEISESANGKNNWRSLGIFTLQGKHGFTKENLDAAYQKDLKTVGELFGSMMEANEMAPTDPLGYFVMDTRIKKETAIELFDAIKKWMKKEKLSFELLTAEE